MVKLERDELQAPASSCRNASSSAFAVSESHTHCATGCLAHSRQSENSAWKRRNPLAAEHQSVLGHRAGMILLRRAWGCSGGQPPLGVLGRSSRSPLGDSDSAFQGWQESPTASAARVKQEGKSQIRRWPGLAPETETRARIKLYA